MHTNVLKHFLRCYGPNHAVAYARWTPQTGSVQTLTEGHGIVSITRTNTGSYTARLQDAARSMTPWTQVESSFTLYNQTLNVVGSATGSIDLEYRSTPYALLSGSGHRLADTPAEDETAILNLFVLIRRGV